MRRRLPILFAALLLIGVFACPKPGSAPDIDPIRCFERCFEHASRAEADRCFERASRAEADRCFEHASRAEATDASGQKAAAKHRAELSRMRELIESNYTFSISGEDVVAGRKAWVLAIRPNINKRPWRQLWIDRKTFDILALRDWSSRSKLRQAVGGASDPDRPRPEPVEGRGSASDTPPAMPRYVPPGFELMGVGTSAGGKWSHIVYSDGLYAISIFQRFPAGLSREHKRRVSVYDWRRGLVLSALRAGRQAVVIADLPAQELERIAGSIP